MLFVYVFHSLFFGYFDKFLEKNEHYNLRQNIVRHNYTLAALGDSLPQVSMDVTDKVVGQQLNDLKNNGIGQVTI